MKQSIINCPHCHQEINVDDVLQHQIEEKLLKEYQSKIANSNEVLAKKEEELKAKELKFEMAKKNENELFLKKVEEERIRLREEEALKAKQQNLTEVEGLKKLLEAKNEEAKNFQKLQLEMMQKEQQLIDFKNKSELELQRQLISQKNNLIPELKKIADEENAQKLLELKKIIDTQNKDLDELKRKADNTSQQLQGEVREEELEKTLRTAFPFDIIEEVKKGMTGADCILTVKNEFTQECGKIIFESKNTKEFTKGWIEKLKTDMRTAGADIAVLVTRTMPIDMEKFGEKEGVWICTFDDTKGLVSALRQTLISVAAALKSQENKGEKTQMLYDYLTSTEFKLQIEAIAEGFLSMQSGITKEKIQMEKIWKEREKQIEKVFLNTVHMYGSIKGIAGNAIGNVSSLELGE
jgi:hypothetical protein